VTVVVYFFKDTGISYVFSAQGHAFMSLIVSFLVVQKINLAFDRYMKARVAIGRTLVSCRDLHQMVMTFTANDASRQGSSWRLEVRVTLPFRFRRDEESRLIVWAFGFVRQGI